MNDRDKATLKLLLGQCCCPNEQTPKPSVPVRSAVHGRPMGHRSPDPQEETPFIPSWPSFDSPQRPIPGHLPSIHSTTGAFLPSGTLTSPDTLTLDTGHTQRLPPNAADHVARTAHFLHGPPQRTDAPPDPRTAGVPSHYASTDLNGDPRVTPTDQTVTPAGQMRATWTLRTQPFTGDPPTDQLIVTTAPYRLATGRVLLHGTLILDYRRQHRWILTHGETGQPDAIWRRTLRVIAVWPGGRSTLPEAPDYPQYDTLHSRSDEATAAVWAARGETPGPSDPRDPDSGFPLYDTLDRGDRLADLLPSPDPPEPPLTSPRWLSPDRAVHVDGPRTSDHALIQVGERLSAYGHVLEPQARPGSWAGLCGPSGEPWVLFEAGGAVTLVRPDGTVILPRRAFEREILRAPPGSFLRFHAEGTLNHTWPPQWAHADCGAAGGLRAVTLHDPWRDSLPGQPPEGSPDPPWWWWPARPRTRPLTLPADAPAAPLHLTLADVWDSRDPDDGGGNS